MASADPLAAFSPATATWFREVFAAPTAAQRGAWEAVSAGENALVIAPTGSGKTLAAFLWAIDDLTRSGPVPGKERCRVLYVLPQGTRRRCRAQPESTADRHHPDGGSDRAGAAHYRGWRALGGHLRCRSAGHRQPPTRHLDHHTGVAVLDADFGCRETLRYVRTVIVDEVHALAEQDQPGTRQLPGHGRRARRNRSGKRRRRDRGAVAIPACQSASLAGSRAPAASVVEAEPSGCAQRRSRRGGRRRSCRGRCGRRARLPPSSEPFSSPRPSARIRAATFAPGVGRRRWCRARPVLQAADRRRPSRPRRRGRERGWPRPRWGWEDSCRWFQRQGRRHEQRRRQPARASRRRRARPQARGWSGVS